MKYGNRSETVVKRFCDYMARTHWLAQWIDRIIHGFLPPPALPQFSGSGAVRDYLPLQPEDPLRPQPMNMGTGPNLDVTSHGPAHTTPVAPNDDKVDTGNWWDRPGWTDWLFHPFTHSRHLKDYNATHSIHECADNKYHGMHGRPCKFEGGSDLQCPAGTTSGWFWSFDCPGVGRIFYVDCCGDRAKTNRVWCNWSNEPDWCSSLPWGRFMANGGSQGHYHCTLAIPDALMRTKDLGGGKFEVVGVDP